MRKKSGVEPDSLSNDRKSVLMKKKMKKKLNTSLGGLKTLKQMSRKKISESGEPNDFGQHFITLTKLLKRPLQIHLLI